MVRFTNDYSKCRLHSKHSLHQKTFAASMSVATILNPNFLNITGDFSLAVTGTQNGDSGIVNLVLVMLKVEDLHL
jgi:hypothetical protein